MAKQIKDMPLKTGVSGNEDILIQDNGVTKRIKASELIEELSPLAVSHDGVVYDSTIDRLNGTFSSIIDSDYNLWSHGIFEQEYDINNTWVYSNYDVTSNIENNVEYILSYDKVNGFVNTGIGSVIFYNSDDVEMKRVAINQKTHFIPPLETIKTIIRFQPVAGDPAPNSGKGTISGIRLSKSDSIKLSDDIHIPKLDTLLIDTVSLENDVSFLQEKTKDLIPISQNLFDKKAIAEGYYCNESGELIVNEKYFISDYIRVQPLDTLWLNTSARFLTYFNKNKQFIGYDTYIENKTLDDNTYYVRITYDMVNINHDIMVNTGGDMLRFEEYDGRMTLGVVTELEEHVDTLVDVFTDDIKNSPNLANPELFVKNAYTLSNGTLGQNSKYFVTDVISVKPGDKIQSNTRARFLATYDINGVFMENRYPDTLIENEVYIVEDGVYGVRYTFWTEDISNIMVYLGEEYMTYEEFGIYYKSPLTDVVKNALPSNSMVGNNADNVTTDKLLSGNILELSDFPNNLKKGTCLTFYCNFDSFDTIEIGKGGEGVYRSDWIKIDGTNITLVHHENSLPVENKETIEHGLNISKFIGITISCDDEGVAHINFITFGGYFKWDVNIGYEFNGTPFVRAGSDITNVTLSATNVNFRKPVWLFGDSYFGVGNNRVIGQLKNLGYFNFLVDGLASQGSNSALGELEKCLKFGTPKYLVWCLGMNDSDDSYKTVLNKVRSITKDNGITLIAMKIPSVPTRLHEGKNDYIESIGIRYVDSYTAVGAISDGTWYDGYLDGDKVHPTSKGATAIAMRILIDVPEILQYGMSKLDEVSGDISGDL